MEDNDKKPLKLGDALPKDRSGHMGWGAGDTETQPDRSNHMTWGSDVDVHDDNKVAKLRMQDVLRWRRIEEDFNSVQEYPHLQHLMTTKWHDHDDHNISYDIQNHVDHFNRLNDADHNKTDAMHASYKSNSEVFNSRLRDPKNRIQGHTLIKAMSDGAGEEFHRQTRQRYHTMDALVSHPLERDAQVYRGIHAGSMIAKLKPGATFTDHGYVGTSVNKKMALSFAGLHDNHDPYSKTADRRVPSDLDGHLTMAKIHVPAGTHGHYLDALPSDYDNEGELNLHRGTHFRVIGHSKTRDNIAQPIHMVHLQVIGQHPNKLITPGEMNPRPEPISARHSRTKFSQAFGSLSGKGWEPQS